jgi:hypothetical protein
MQTQSTTKLQGKPHAAGAWLAVLLAVALPTAGCEEGDSGARRTPCDQLVAEGAWVRDLRSGLLWESFVQAAQLTHGEAQSRCQAMGARLPTRKEVEALRTPQAGDACQLPACAFRGARCGTIQCGSSIGISGQHWGVAMGGGGLVGIAAGEARGSVCVKSGGPQK